VRQLRRLGAGGLVLIALTATVGTFGAWLSTGTGATDARAGSAAPLTTLDVAASADAQLSPGGTGDLMLRITNPNAFTVTVTEVAPAGAVTTDAGAGCDADTGVGFAPKTVTLTIPAGVSRRFTIVGSVSMSAASSNACQGAMFSIPVALTGGTA
jgi:hypothetical protein